MFHSLLMLYFTKAVFFLNWKGQNSIFCHVLFVPFAYNVTLHRGVDNLASQRLIIRCGLHDHLHCLICCKHTLVYSDLTFYACWGLQKWLLNSGLKNI